jgi:hypothetical protein
MAKPSKGRLVVLEGDLANSEEGTLEFFYNPTEYSISKSNSWQTKANKGHNVHKYEFAGGEPRQLQMELFFDSYLTANGAPPKDLRKILNKLFNFMMIDKGGQTRGPNSRMSKPPKCRLMWGRQTNHLAFQCYITSCSVKYTMFKEDGVPIRATANLTLKEALDSEDRLPTNPTSRGEPGRRLHRVVEGDRLDLIAFREYGEADKWRLIADANRLKSLRDLSPGMVLAIPPS